LRSVAGPVCSSPHYESARPVLLIVGEHLTAVAVNFSVDDHSH